MKKIAVNTSNAPAAIGPYSQAIQIDGFIFASGQLGMDTNKVFPTSVAEQARQSIENLYQILQAADYDINHIVKTTIFLTDIQDFPEVNKVYGEFFAEPYPARSTIQVAALPMGAKVEIEAIAKK
ncbi:MAG: Rid family detoxifying hydrolase [Bacillota bacterium]|jgi:2-iminobutanoate/2-iminopropanoate deaminase